MNFRLLTYETFTQASTKSLKWPMEVCSEVSLLKVYLHDFFLILNVTKIKADQFVCSNIDHLSSQTCAAHTISRLPISDNHQKLMRVSSPIISHRVKDKHALTTRTNDGRIIKGSAWTRQEVSNELQSTDTSASMDIS